MTPTAGGGGAIEVAKCLPPHNSDPGLPPQEFPPRDPLARDSLHLQICNAARLLETNKPACDWLLAKGLRTDAVGWAEVGLARVRLHDGTFEPDEDGQQAYVQPVPGFGGHVDLVAWQPANPARWWLRRGAATVLGEQDIDRASCRSLPLHLFPTPMGWLLADDTICKCVVLAADGWREVALGVGRVTVADSEHGRCVTRSMRQAQRWRGPEVFVRAEYLEHKCSKIPRPAVAAS